MPRIYLAASWRNAYHRDMVVLLRKHGHTVYDFKNPDYATGFAWSQVGMPDKPTAVDQRRTLLSVPRCAQGFVSDFRAMLWCDICVMLIPSGRSAHLELGYCAGAWKRTVIYLRDGEEPDLMNLLASDLVTTDDELIEALRV